MIDKESYIKLREEEEIPLSLFYEYMKDNSNYIGNLSLEEFEVYFPQFMSHFMGGMIQTKKGIKFINFQSIVNKVYSHFNTKYELN